jgi:hypothetical protein
MDGEIELRPVIASYSGSSYNAIKSYLDKPVLDVIAGVARSPALQSQLDPEVCAELIEMHVFTTVDSWIRLDTAVFLEEDLREVNRFASTFGQELAGLVGAAAAPLRSEPPVVTNFLVGIIGIVQSLGHALREAQMTLDWWNYGGKYARSKVDFEQNCEAAAAAGPDLLNKTILRGDRYTAVFTGPGGETFPIQPACSAPGQAGYIWQINHFLTDAFALLLSGQAEHPALRSAAEQAGLFRNGQPEAAVLTNETISRHLPAIQNVRTIVRDYSFGKLPSIQELLYSTTGGRQGVPAGNMHLHLWRYLRRAVARALYTSGFFTDRVPETGVITIFYENNIGILNELLS